MARLLTEPSVVALLDPVRRTALVALAERQARPPIDLLNDAVDALVEADRWQRAEIEAALKEADAGDFASAGEVEAAFALR
jgi:RHH-type transcriptional regulator, rel operon repressor / antitoxin RelB